MEWPKELLDIFDDPILDDVRPKVAPLTLDDKRVKAFMEVTQWSEDNGNRKPKNDGDLKERIMARTLMALRRDSKDFLADYDRLNLLKEE